MIASISITMSKRQPKLHLSHRDTDWAKKFEMVTSTRRRRHLHTRLAKECQREMIAEKMRKIAELEKKAEKVAFDTDEGKMLRGEIRSLKDQVVDIGKMKLLPRPDETFSMWL